tara:strand:- start:6975 stop:8480 length:1506 start_codon:yes stop_codon:yes gene_type:complete
MDMNTLLMQATKMIGEATKDDPPTQKQKDRTHTTLSGTPREDNSSFSNFLDDYGIMSNLQRFLMDKMGKPHSDGENNMIPGIPHPGVTPNANFIGIDTNPERTKKRQKEFEEFLNSSTEDRKKQNSKKRQEEIGDLYSGAAKAWKEGNRLHPTSFTLHKIRWRMRNDPEALRQQEEQNKQSRIDELYKRLEKTPTKVPSKQDIDHTNAMEGNDTSLAYMAPGEQVMPVAVQKAYPELAIAVKQAIGSMGKNPEQFVVASNAGDYNRKTGVQQFNWYDDVYKYGLKAADYVANNPYAKAAATGALVGGAQYLGGASGQTALASGLGATVGSYGGQYLDQALTKGGPGFGSLPQAGTYTSKTYMDAAKNLYDRTSQAETYGAALGAGIGGLVGYKPNDDDLPDPRPTVDTSNMSLANIPTTIAPSVNFLESNDNPNYLARPSAELPIAPMFRLPSGVSYKQKVKDKDTGAFTYNEVDEEDQGGFMRNLSSSARRQGFGNAILV